MGEKNPKVAGKLRVLVGLCSNRPQYQRLHSEHRLLSRQLGCQPRSLRAVVPRVGALVPLVLCGPGPSGTAAGGPSSSDSVQEGQSLLLIARWLDGAPLNSGLGAMECVRGQGVCHLLDLPLPLWTDRSQESGVRQDCRGAPVGRSLLCPALQSRISWLRPFRFQQLLYLF